MSIRNNQLVTVQRLDSYKSSHRYPKTSVHEAANNRPRPMPSPVDSSADVHLIVQGAT